MIGVLLNTEQMSVDAAADMVAACFEGVDATKGIHLCNGNLKGRPMSGVLRVAPWYRSCSGSTA